MIELADFYTQMDAPRSLGQDEQLILSEGVRVQVTETGWTALFEGVQVDGALLARVLESTRHTGSALPFLSRSGHLGMTWQSPSPLPDTSLAVRALRAALRQVSET